MRIDVVKLRKVRRHYTGTVSICTSDHLSEYLMVPLDFVEVGTSRDLSPRVIVFSDERSRNGFCVTTYLRCDTSTVEISYDELYGNAGVSILL